MRLDLERMIMAIPWSPIQSRSPLFFPLSAIRKIFLKGGRRVGYDMNKGSSVVQGRQAGRPAAVR